MIIQDPYGTLSLWNSSFHFCNWSGVTCGKRHRRVTIVKLVSQGLVGSLSPHVGNLSFLRSFLLANNSFQGNIPQELGQLSRLQQLNLELNKFSGVIPTNLSRCSKLEKLGLSSNKLVGNIPKEVGSLSNLTFLALNSNNLTGGIPSSLGNLTSMEKFYAFDNPLGGSIPDTLGHWTNLRDLSLGGCNLNGTIPRSIYNLSLVVNFWLPMNQLTGSLPPALGAMLPNLDYLILRDNQLTGLPPPSIANCSKLVCLEMDSNNFRGMLTIDFSRLMNIVEISFGGNHFGSREADEMKFIDSLKNCSKLQRLHLYNSGFQGVLPNSIGNISNQLSFLDLSRNQLYGNLPTSIGNLVGLTTLRLHTNLFTGKIPSTIGMLQNLQRANLYDNQFSGQIPDSVGNLSLLTTFSLASNRFEGHIPSSLGNCHLLLGLYLNDNNLSGKIPEPLLQLSSLSIVLDLSQNNLFGSFPAAVGHLKNLNKLDLSYNKLSGNIPSSLSRCTSLVYLYLEGNSFQGVIPTSLSSLRGVKMLDLSNNNLSGQIPQFLEQFSLEYLNLSFNNFEGQLQVKGVFANASAISVIGNSRLCGGLVELGLPKCKRTKKHKKWFTPTIIVISVACLFLAVLCFVYPWRKKKIKGQGAQSSMNEGIMMVSYSELLKATDGFSKANLIGKGGFSSVYKGIIHHDNRAVAVKVLHLQNLGADTSFIAECKAWRSIRHRNLLKIITSCSGVDFQGNDFKALVYEFMPNGSLDDWLHSSARTSRLNLLQRINILIDVASALDYLHNHCQTAIVHCDLKPSNILLDDDMTAHLGDFGLARFLQTDSYQNSSSRIRGTIGYAAPEYALGSEMSTNGDTYSFGILLLEVMTRKRPTDIMFGESGNLHQFAKMALPDNVTDMVDQELLYNHEEDANDTQNSILNSKKEEECLASIIKIGVACSIDYPPGRMNIKNVLPELQHIREELGSINISEV